MENIVARISLKDPDGKTYSFMRVFQSDEIVRLKSPGSIIDYLKYVSASPNFRNRVDSSSEVHLEVYPESREWVKHWEIPSGTEMYETVIDSESIISKKEGCKSIW